MEKIEVGYCRDCKFWKEWGKRKGYCPELNGNILLNCGAAESEGMKQSDMTHPDFGCVLWEQKGE